MAIDVKPEDLKLTEDEEKLLADLVAGKPAPHEQAQRLLGRATAIAWWDQEDMHAAEAAAVLGGDNPTNLQPGEVVVSGRKAIPTRVWEKHRQDYNAGGHGLKLEAEPAAVLIYRTDDGSRWGAVIGYRQAS